MNAARIPAVVRAATMVARDVRQLQLASSDGSPMPAFTPGAHIDLHLGPGVVRQYSLCGEPDDPCYTIAVKLEPASRGGSLAVHEKLQPGAHVDLSPPRNNFPLQADAPHSVLVAGGIGVTPLLGMARSLVRLDRSFALHYFARSEEHAAFADLLNSPAFADHSHLYLGLGHDRTAAALKEALANRAAGAQLYVCGPRAFMDLVRELANQQAWPAASVHVEYFGAGESAAVGSSRPIEVTLARSGIKVDVPADAPIVDALRAAGVAVETSCEQGVCGTCVAAVLDGVPEHHDLFLTDAEKASGRCMAICVSRAATPHLVLDL